MVVLTCLASISGFHFQIQDICALALNISLELCGTITSQFSTRVFAYNLKQS